MAKPEQLKPQTTIIAGILLTYTAWNWRVPQTSVEVHSDFRHLVMFVYL